MRANNVMRANKVLRLEAVDALMRTLGLVDTERFITLLKRDNFDYTEWRRDLWADMTIEEVYNEAVKHHENIQLQV